MHAYKSKKSELLDKTDIMIVLARRINPNCHSWTFSTNDMLQAFSSHKVSDQYQCPETSTLSASCRQGLITSLCHMGESSCFFSWTEILLKSHKQFKYITIWNSHVLCPYRLKSGTCTVRLIGTDLRHIHVNIRRLTGCTCSCIMYICNTICSIDQFCFMWIS